MALTLNKEVESLLGVIGSFSGVVVSLTIVASASNIETFKLLVVIIDQLSVGLESLSTRLFVHLIS